MRASLLLLLPALACQAGSRDLPPVDTSPTPDGCAYPADAVDPMALDEVLYPYSWPQARHRDGVRSGPLDLHDVPCNTDPDIDWSPHDVLLFVSIPAW